MTNINSSITSSINSSPSAVSLLDDDANVSSLDLIRSLTELGASYQEQAASIAQRQAASNVSGEQKSQNSDPYTLRARGGDISNPNPSKRPTDPIGLSRSILHVLAQNPDGFVNVQFVGPVALRVVIDAINYASDVAERRTKGIVLVARPSKYDAEIGGKRAKGDCLRIFAIPIKYAL